MAFEKIIMNFFPFSPGFWLSFGFHCSLQKDTENSPLNSFPQGWPENYSITLTSPFGFLTIGFPFKMNKRQTLLLG